MLKAITTTITPKDVLTLYIKFLGTYTSSQLSEIQDKIISDKLANVIEISKPIFRDLKIVVSPIKSTNTLTFIDYIRLVVNEKLRFATGVKVSGYDIMTSKEYEEIKEREKMPLIEQIIGKKTPLEMITGISGTHIFLLLAGLGALTIYLYRPSVFRR